MLQNSNKIAGKEEIISYFDQLLDKYGDSHLSLDWNSKASQELRYIILSEMFGYADKKKDISILDVGCGLGHLYDHLKDRGIVEKFKIRYSGIDISRKSIEFAKQKNPGIDFKVIDLLEDKVSDKYDLVMASGIFNIRMADAQSHKDSVHKMLSRMFSLAKIGMAVNFICREVIYLVSGNQETDRYFYFTPEEIVAFCKTLTSKYILRHDYHPGDFTVYLFR